MATVTEVAKAAGVAYSTASIALRGVGSVAPGTRERVLEAARRLGYVPNPAAAVLVSRRKRGRGTVREMVVALLRFGGRDAEEAAIRGRENGRMRELAAASGYALEVVDWEDYGTPAQLSRVLWACGVQGLIVQAGEAPRSMRARDFAGLQWERFAVVKLTRGIDDLRVMTVRSSVFAQMREALKRVAAGGYKRIGVLLLRGTASEEDDHARLGAVKSYADWHPETVKAVGQFEWPSRQGELPAAARDWLWDFRPDAVIGFTAGWWRYRLEAAGFRIPEDFAFFGLPVAPEETAGSGRALPGVVRDLVGQSFPAALQMLHGELAAGRRGIPEQAYEYLLPVLWQESS